MNSIISTTQIKEKNISIANAALISGLGLLIMVLTVPFAEFYIFPKLITENPVLTANNIIDNRLLFTTSIFLHFITLICDVVVAWALYVFLKPVFKYLSLLTAWFRLIYAAMYLVALVNLIKVLNLLDINKQSKLLDQTQFYDSITFYINSFHHEWSFGLIIFGIYLILLGYLVFKAEYVPKIFGILLIIAGFGYLINTLGLFLFPNINTEFLLITFFGELIFMIWLLIKGSKIKTIQKIQTD
ncbi:DUF4386 domain-containing protein [Lutibacter sp. B1]|uniref:DUF4386 domain-containing protein n=1 Tax=Lutibacter sp. B1 TaxID=2725996 RepID=UPI0014568150|nr:DUF4386 domain-containing protein [Lutibacter sp. B1]NLP58089.1 DUF4386 domain-containing protein [Lutibacter sp. B1]